MGMFAAMMLVMPVAGAGNGYWDRDAGNGYLFPDNIGDRIGIEDDSPEFKLEVAVSEGLGFFGVSTAAGDDGDIFKIDSSGNVGIGDQSLTYKLEVNGEAEFDGALRARDATGIGFKDDAGNLGLWVQDGGNVGIGVSGAGEKLEIDGNVVFTATDDRIIYVGNSPSMGHNGYDLTVRAEHAVKFVSDVNGGSLKLVGGDGDGTFGNGGDIYLYGGIKGGVAGFDGNVILAHTSTNAHGKVGIATADPETELHVEGTITVDQKIRADDTGGLELATREGTTRLFIQDGGYVGIGDASPGAHLVVGDDTNRGIADGTGDVYIQNDLEVDGIIYGDGSGLTNLPPIADDSLDWDKLTDSMTLDATTTIDMDTNSADLNFDSDTLFIDSSADAVGIGIADPSTTLHVDGDVAFNEGSSLSITNPGGEITVTHSYHEVNDDLGNSQLTTINGGDVAGQILIITPKSGDTITVKDGTGNLRLEGSSGDFSMDSAEDTLVLLYDGTNWLEISRSDNS